MLCKVHWRIAVAHESHTTRPDRTQRHASRDHLTRLPTSPVTRHKTHMRMPSPHVAIYYHAASKKPERCAIMVNWRHAPEDAQCALSAVSANTRPHTPPLRDRRALQFCKHTCSSVRRSGTCLTSHNACQLRPDNHTQVKRRRIPRLGGWLQAAAPPPAAPPDTFPAHTSREAAVAPRMPPAHANRLRIGALK